MGIKRWSIAVLVLGAFDVLLFTGPKHQFQAFVNSVEARLQGIQQSGNQASGNGGSTTAGGSVTTTAAGAKHDSGKSTELTGKKNQQPIASKPEARQVTAGAAGVAPGQHQGGRTIVQWYHHDGSTIEMHSVRYDNGNQFALKGTYKQYTGDLVVLVGQFDASRTKVVNWWTYSVPVEHGEIDSTITLPYHGFLEVTVAPVKITSSGEFTTSNHFTFTNVTNNAPTLSSKSMALLQSWLINYNENPGIQSLAEQVTAPVRKNDAGASSVQLRIDEMRAVSNWVSAHIAYNWPAYKDNTTPWQQASKTVSIRVGVCNDESALAAAMLRSIGIPSRVVAGTASAPGVSGPHQWNESWDGQKWVLFDPTWDQVYYDSQTNQIGLPSKINDQYFNISPAVFDKTHLDGKVAAW